MKRLILELGGKSVQLYLDDALEARPGEGGRRRDGGVRRARGPGVLAADAHARAARPQGRRARRARGGRAHHHHRRPAGRRRRSLGPVVSAGSRDRIERLVAAGVDAGGRVVDRRQAARAHGARLLLRAHRRRHRRQREPRSRSTEVFGPVITVQGYGDLDEAVAITNDSRVRPLRRGVHRRPRHRERPGGADPHRHGAGEHRPAPTATRRWVATRTAASAASVACSACGRSSRPSTSSSGTADPRSGVTSYARRS